MAPPAAVLAEPPAPVLAEPPAPPFVEPPSPVGVIQDTFVGFETEHADWAADDDPDRVQLPTWFRYVSRRPKQTRRSAPTRKQSLVRLVLFTVLAGLIPIAAGVRYFQMQATTGHIAGVPVVRLRHRRRASGSRRQTFPVGRRARPPWATPSPPVPRRRGRAPPNTAEQASTVMARCLHVPVSAVDGAFGMGDAVSQLTAEVTSPSYADPGGNGER